MDTINLVKSARLGNDDAFYELIQQRKELLYRTAYAYVKKPRRCFGYSQRHCFQSIQIPPETEYEMLSGKVWLKNKKTNIAYLIDTGKVPLWFVGN